MSDEIIEKKKRWLYRYKNNLQKIDRLRNKLIVLTEKIESVKSPNYSGMPRGGTPVTVEELLSDKIDLENRIKRLEDKGIEYRREILEAIDSLDDCRHSDVLEHWFICGESADVIGENIGYSTRYVFSLYAKALLELQIPDLIE